MFRAELRTKYKTHYHLELIDSRTGKVRQRVETKNVFLANWWNGFKNTYSGSRNFIVSIGFGKGSGEPAESDTALFSQLWTVGTSSETRSIDQENKSITITASLSLPATSSYVGTITEIGCFSDACASGNTSATPSPTIFTHALLKDAEGNPIAVVKTDTDILTVTVMITVSYSATEPWKLVKYPGYLAKFRFKNLSNWGIDRSQWCDVYLALGTTMADPPIYLNSYGGYQTIAPSGSTLANGSSNKSTKKMTFANTRIATSIGEARPIYYSFVNISGLIYATLPNASIFPFYMIEGINIGIGDGMTIQYDNPLDYFVSDSETVYKNGMALVRGTDYTIDHRNNHNRLPELAATKNAKLSGGVTVAAGTSNGHKQMLFQRTLNNTNAYLIDAVSVGWKADSPLIIEFEDAGDVNTFYVPSWVVTGTITLSSSADGENWTQVKQVEHISGRVNTETFDVVNARYWMIEGTNTSWAAHSFTTDNMAEEVFLGYVGDPYIRFTEPPADGDVITMNVQMDRPFKNGNFVIDVSAELQLS